MALAVEMHNTGDRELQRDVAVIIEHVLSDRPGDCRTLLAHHAQQSKLEG